jgi:uncharacterized protein YbjT (DUF2867 family)
MTNTIHPSATLVLGGTGKTGRRVAQRLAALHVPVRTGSRAGDPPFDWQNRDTWPAALRDVDSVYLSYFPDLAVPEAVDEVAAFTTVAVESGVRRLVLLSGRGEPEAERSEHTVRESGVAWTILRASWFAQNFSEGYMLDGILDGELVLPGGAVPEPFIDVEDIADAAVAAFTGTDLTGRNRHDGELYEMTGPRAITFAEALSEMRQATGRDLRFRSVSVSEYVGMLTGYGVPADTVQLLSYLFTEVLDGRNAAPSDGVQRALGRPPRDFWDYARTTAASGVWMPVALDGAR